MSNNNSESIVGQIQELLGPVVLLPIPRGQKRPVITGWQKMTLADMTAEKLAALDPKENIGVLLGQASEGLCSIDLDDDAYIELFLKLNPKLTDTLRTKGKRGCNFWVRIKGEFPSLGKLRNGDGNEIGEWRSDGGQTLFWGVHPSGCKYQRLVKARPVELEFAEIQWPKEWALPWIITTDDALIQQHGQPFTLGKRGTPAFNYPFFAARFADERQSLWAPSENVFYQYAPANGLWQRISPEQIKRQLCEDLKTFADQVRLPQLINHRSNFRLSDVVELVKGFVEKADAFDLPSKIIHLNNGMLDLGISPPELRQFSPDFYSRNLCPFPFQDDAVCPRFKADLLATALDPEDIDLLQRWCGSVLLRHNAAQKIMLLTGTAGGGKGTLIDILERVIGKSNVAELRTELLFERFELARFIGKTLLSGKDVPGDFLAHHGASALKKIVGHDLLTAEVKGSSQGVNLRGDFALICTSNSRLSVKLDGDVEAWRRRLLWVEYRRPKPAELIPDFADKLVATEGPGIVLWMIEGAVLHLAELAERGDFQLTEPQRKRIDDLLNESDSIRHFAEERIIKDADADVSTEELVEAYFGYCDDHGWHAQPRRTVENQLSDIMLQVHQVNRRNDVLRGGKACKGYKGLYVVCPSTNPY